MKVSPYFDSGSLYDYEIDGAVVTFNLKPGQKILNVLLEECSETLRVRLALEHGSKFEGMVSKQGLLWGKDDQSVTLAQLENEGNGIWSTELTALQGSIRLLTRYPYGRNALDQLVCDTRKCGHMTYRLLHRQQRTVPLFEFGKDDGVCPIFYFIAGEDVWETSACWVADYMIRLLCSEPDFGNGWLNRALVRIVPLTSPYSASLGIPASYLTMEGKSIYGAATWGDDCPPPEYSLLRELVTESINHRRLASLLTMHSWQGQYAHSGMEALRTSGPYAITGERLKWMERTLDEVTANVPHGKTVVAEKIWYPGLARDWFLREHNVVTFRIEVTTVNSSYKMLFETAEQLLHNFSGISDWRNTFPD